MSPPTRSSKTKSKSKQRRTTDLKNVKAQLMGHFTRVAKDGYEVLEDDLQNIIQAYLGRIRYEIEINEDKLVAKKDGIITGRVDEEQLLQIVASIPGWNRLARKHGFVSSTIITRGLLQKMIDAQPREKQDSVSNAFFSTSS